MKTLIVTLAIIAATPAVAWDFRDSSNSPKIYSPQGEYLGNLNGNEFDPNSVANPFGRYGSEFSYDSVNNPYGPNGNILDALKGIGDDD
jgi:hypothetical protein